MYPAAVLANHLAGLGKAESGAGLLRRVVRIEDAFLQFVGDAGAGVDDVDSDQGVALHAHAGYQLAAVGHGLLGVDQQVENGGLDQAPINVANDRPIGELNVKAEVGFVRLGMEEIAQLADYDVDVLRGTFDLAFSDVSKKVLEDSFEPLRLGEEDRESLAASAGHVAGVGRAVRVGGLDLLPVLVQQLQIHLER